MAETKKYYWLKLKRDFFKRHDIRIIEEMPNGKDYILFYLKLLLESIDHEGSLRFSDTIPYNEQMLSVVTNTNIDIVRSAMKLFIDLNMMTVFDDLTIYMNEVDKLIGSETEWAKKKRLQRAKEDNVPQLSSECPTELELNKEKEKNIDKELFTTTTTDEPPMLSEVYLYFKELLDEDAINEAEKFHAYNANKGWSCLPGWKAAADLWIARIKDHKVGK
jgi:predicted phage replisome organizer